MKMQGKSLYALFARIGGGLRTGLLRCDMFIFHMPFYYELHHILYK